MSAARRDPDPRPLTPDERAFVERVAELYRGPDPTPARRVAFTAGLERRLERRTLFRSRRYAWLGAAFAATGALLLLVQASPTSDPGSERAGRGTAPSGALPERSVAGAGAAPADGAWLSLSGTFSGEPGADWELSLPEDYVAIEGLWL